MKSLLLIEDDLIMGESLAQRFELEGYAVSWAQRIGDAAIDRTEGWDVVVCDVRLPDGLATDWFAGLPAAVRAVPWFFLTGYGSVNDAVAAIRLGRAIEPFDISWFEEPVPPEDHAGYRQVKRALAMPIAGGEAEFTRWGFRPLITERLLDILQPDVCAAGGISECGKIADMANAFGVRVNPHVWGTGVALAASLQLIAALPHNPPGLHPVEPLLEFDRSEHPIRMAVLQEPIEQHAGWVDVPQGPGLGIEIDRAAFARFAV